uniref:Uncharacterized protein n=1 Tax=Anolis carolinensis TaxID=28377 RepID=A0A803SUU0_ANOCA
MTFAELLDRMGGMGRFQVVHVALLVTPVLLTASHNLLQNFSAAVPEHHCRVRLVGNGTEWHSNRTQATEEDLLWAAIPKDASGKPEKCRRFVRPRWHLPNASADGGNGTEWETEPCHDGWVYDQSVFTNTIIMEVSGQRGQRASEGSGHKDNRLLELNGTPREGPSIYIKE